MKMKLECTSRNYSVEMDEDEFDLIESYEHEFCPDDNLIKRLEAIEGVDDIEYNGHFGRYIYLRIEVEHDHPNAHSKVTRTIREYVKHILKTMPKDRK